MQKELKEANTPELLNQKCGYISQNSQGNTSVIVSFLIKLQTSGLQLY